MQGVVGARMRAAITCVVFRHTLAINAAELAGVGAGRGQTLMSVDAERLVGLCMGFHELWSLPLQVGTTTSGTAGLELGPFRSRAQRTGCVRCAWSREGMWPPLAPLLPPGPAQR